MKPERVAPTATLKNAPRSLAMTIAITISPEDETRLLTCAVAGDAEGVREVLEKAIDPAVERVMNSNTSPDRNAVRAAGHDPYSREFMYDDPRLGRITARDRVVMGQPIRRRSVDELMELTRQLHAWFAANISPDYKPLPPEALTREAIYAESPAP